MFLTLFNLYWYNNAPKVLPTGGQLHVTSNCHYRPCAHDQRILPDSCTWKHARGNLAKGSRILRASAEFVLDFVETTFQIDRNAPYLVRLAALNDAHIGLWDVLASCSRKASSDAIIRDAKCNNFLKYCQPIPGLIEFVWMAARPLIIGVVWSYHRLPMS